MLKVEDSVKGEKSFGVMIYEPPYTCLSGRQAGETRLACPEESKGTVV
jgi:hypothetical protein